jgi:tripartite-type tricarboxylate transporter receptor subunit TctC
VLADSDAVQRLASDGAHAVGSTSEAYRDFLEKETETWGAVIKTAGVQPDE